MTYFGPAPSQVQRELIGPYQLLQAGQVDQDGGHGDAASLPGPDGFG